MLGRSIAARSKGRGRIRRATSAELLGGLRVLRISSDKNPRPDFATSRSNALGSGWRIARRPYSVSLSSVPDRPRVEGGHEAPESSEVCYGVLAYAINWGGDQDVSGIECWRERRLENPGWSDESVVSSRKVADGGVESGEETLEDFVRRATL